MTDRIIFISITALVLLGLVSFGADPRYEKGVWVAMAAVTNCLSVALGAKFGLATPKPDPDKKSDL